MTIRGNVLVIAASLVAAAGTTVQASDCQCTHRGGHAVEALSGHKAAFAGRATAVEPTGDVVLVTFDVARTWKGKSHKTVTVSTPANECGSDFVVGDEYLVYARQAADKTLTTDVCSPGLPLAWASAAVRQLDLHAGYSAQPLAIPPARAARTAGTE